VVVLVMVRMSVVVLVMRVFVMLVIVVVAVGAQGDFYASCKIGERWLRVVGASTGSAHFR